MIVAVPMSIMMMGAGYFSNADTALATMSAPSCWLLNSMRMFSPVLMPAPTTMGGLPRRRVSAFSIMKFIGGTTLDKIAPLTSWISQPYSVNKFIRSMLIWSAVLRLSVSMRRQKFQQFPRLVKQALRKCLNCRCRWPTSMGMSSSLSTFPAGVIIPRGLCGLQAVRTQESCLRARARGQLIRMIWAAYSCATKASASSTVCICSSIRTTMLL